MLGGLKRGQGWRIRQHCITRNVIRIHFSRRSVMDELFKWCWLFRRFHSSLRKKNVSFLCGRDCSCLWTWRCLRTSFWYSIMRWLLCYHVTVHAWTIIGQFTGLWFNRRKERRRGCTWVQFLPWSIPTSCSKSENHSANEWPNLKFLERIIRRVVWRIWKEIITQEGSLHRF